jgi:hypothetical protein
MNELAAFYRGYLAAERQLSARCYRYEPERLRRAWQQGYEYSATERRGWRTW